MRQGPAADRLRLQGPALLARRASTCSSGSTELHALQRRRPATGELGEAAEAAEEGRRSTPRAREGADAASRIGSGRWPRRSSVTEAARAARARATPSGSRSAPGQPAGAARGARQARRLGGAARLRRAALGRHRALQPPERPLPLRVLRPDRAGPARRRRQHQLRPGRLPPLRAAARGAAPAGDGDGRGAARRRRLVQPLAARRRHRRRAAAGGRGSRPPADRRGLRALPAHVRARRRTTRTRSTSTRSTCWSRATRRRFPLEDPPPARSSARSPSTPAPSSPTAPRCRPASARSRRRSPACSPRATAATTASTPRCSRPG